MCQNFMNTNLKTVVIVGAISLLLTGCCTTRQTQWEYKVTNVPHTAGGANTAAPQDRFERTEKYLNALGAEGWVLVSEEQGIYFLKRLKR